MPALPLPLHCYDEAGIIKPPRWLYWFLIVNSVDWVIFLFAVASRRHTTQLLEMFYPEKTLLWSKLAATLPFILVALLLGNRERLWKKTSIRWWRYTPAAIWSGISASLVVVGGQLQALNWQFQPLLAAQIVSLLLLGVLIARSRHLRLMLADWHK